MVFSDTPDTYIACHLETTFWNKGRACKDQLGLSSGGPSAMNVLALSSMNCICWTPTYAWTVYAVYAWHVLACNVDIWSNLRRLGGKHSFWRQAVTDQMKKAGSCAHSWLQDNVDQAVHTSWMSWNDAFMTNSFQERQLVCTVWPMVSCSSKCVRKLASLYLCKHPFGARSLSACVLPNFHNRLGF